MAEITTNPIPITLTDAVRDVLTLLSLALRPNARLIAYRGKGSGHLLDIILENIIYVHVVWEGNYGENIQ